MKNLGKIIGRVCAGAVAASLIPFRFSRDKQTGAFKIGALLWAVKKTPGEDHDRYELELLPFVGSKQAAEGAEAPAEEAETPAEEAKAPAEEASAEESPVA